MDSRSERSKFESMQETDYFMKRRSVIKCAAVAVVAFLSVATSRVSAIATINFAADDLVYFADRNGAFLKDGCLVEMGQFSISDAALSALGSGGLWLGNYYTLVSDFIPLSTKYSSTIGTGTTTNPFDANAGAIYASFTGSNAGFAGGAVYLLVFNSNTAASATEVGVFKGNSSGAGAWNYPVNMTTGTANLDADDALLTPLIGTYVSGISGASNPYNNGENGNANPTISELRLAGLPLSPPTPEPPTVALVGLGVLGIAGIIRRRRLVLR
jgi:hypothetical protein